MRLQVVVIEYLVPVAEGFGTPERRSNRYVREFPNACQHVTYLSCFEVELSSIAEMLKMAATTISVEWTRRRNTPGRGLLQGNDFAESVVSTPGRETNVNHIPRCRARYKNRQTVQIADAASPVREAFNSKSPAPDLRLDLLRAFVYLPAVVRHRLSRKKGCFTCHAVS